VIDGVREVCPRHRLSLSIADRDQWHLPESAIQRLQLRQVQATMERGQHGYGGAASHRKSPVVEMAVDDVELLEMASTASSVIDQNGLRSFSAGSACHRA
jgi:hypothetical protein